MAACHILQTEVYSSQTVDDTLDISLAPTAATLEEDLNYIRSVIKAVHGGSTWYDVHESISDIVSDFAVEHYTTAEDAARAGQHKTIHADGLYAPEANITNSITLTAANYVINNEVLGPDNEPNGTRFWLSGPAWSAGAESGVIIGPVGTDDYFHKIRLKTNILEITGDTGAYATYILEDSTSEFFRVSSTGHTNQANVVLSDTLFSIKPYINNTAQDSPLEYVYSADFWRTTRFRSISSAPATLTSTDHALEIGNISSGSGIRFGNNTILAVRTGNQPEQLKLNPAGTEAVSAWGDVSAAGAFPLRVGSENYGVWHQGNQGHNSGLDADTVDGFHGTLLQNALEYTLDVLDETDYPAEGLSYRLAELSFAHLADDSNTVITTTIPFSLYIEFYSDLTPQNPTSITSAIYSTFVGQTGDVIVVPGLIRISYVKDGTSSYIKGLDVELLGDAEEIIQHSNYFTPYFLRLHMDTATHVATLTLYTRLSRVHLVIQTTSMDGDESATQKTQISIPNTNKDLVSVSNATPASMVEAVLRDPFIPTPAYEARIHTEWPHAGEVLTRQRLSNMRTCCLYVWYDQSDAQDSIGFYVSSWFNKVGRTEFHYTFDTTSGTTYQFVGTRQTFWEVHTSVLFVNDSSNDLVYHTVELFDEAQQAIYESAGNLTSLAYNGYHGTSSTTLRDMLRDSNVAFSLDWNSVYHDYKVGIDSVNNEAYLYGIRQGSPQKFTKILLDNIGMLATVYMDNSYVNSLHAGFTNGNTSQFYIGYTDNTSGYILYYFYVEDGDLSKVYKQTMQVSKTLSTPRSPLYSRLGDIWAVAELSETTNIPIYLYNTQDSTYKKYTLKQNRRPVSIIPIHDPVTGKDYFVIPIIDMTSWIHVYLIIDIHTGEYYGYRLSATYYEELVAMRSLHPLVFQKSTYGLFFHSGLFVTKLRRLHGTAGLFAYDISLALDSVIDERVAPATDILTSLPANLSITQETDLPAFTSDSKDSLGTGRVYSSIRV